MHIQVRTCSEEAGVDTHIKGRLLGRAVILMKAVVLLLLICCLVCFPLVLGGSVFFVFVLLCITLYPF